MENSVEGSVANTLDELASGPPLMISREVLLDVQFALLARPGTRLEDVRQVASHPHGSAQTRGWLRRHLPLAAVVAAGLDRRCRGPGAARVRTTRR